MADAPPSANAYCIPYRVLVPRDVDGLLVAGRAASASHAAMAAIRIMPPCFAMGEAAGVAAAMCVRGNSMPRHVDSTALRAQLRLQGAYVGEDA